MNALVWLLAGAALLRVPAEGAVFPSWEYVDLEGVLGLAEESYAYDLAVDSQGAVYVAGARVIVTGELYEALVRKVVPYGTVVWTVSNAGAGSSVYESSARAVALYPTSGTAYDVIAGGQIWNGALTGMDAWLARYTAYGATVWSTTVSRAAVSTDAIEAIVVIGGTIFVAGRAANSVTDTDLWVAQFSGNGSFISEFSFPPDLFNLDEAVLAITADLSAGLYVAGYVTVAGEDKNIWVRKFTPDLSSEIWTITINGARSATDYASGVAVDSFGDVLVVGTQAAVAGKNQDIWAGKISASGVVLWTRTLDGGEGDHDEAAACAVDASGSLYVTGYVDRPTDVFTDLWLAKLTPAGATVWEYDRGGTASDDDRGRGVKLDSQGFIYVAGELVERNTGRRSMFVAKVQDFTPPVSSQPSVTRPHASPNPFRPGSGGRYDAPGITFRLLPAGATVRLYTLTGELVTELTDSDNDGVIDGPGIVNGVWDVKNRQGRDLASGVYLYVVAPRSGPVTRGKVVIIR